MLRLVKSLKTMLMLAFIGASLWSTASYADSSAVSKKPGEDDSAFVHRITKQDIVTDATGHAQIGSTSALIKNTETLIAFTKDVDLDNSVPGNAPDYDIDINVFLKKSDGSYTWLDPTAVCEIEGGSASLRSFFYADVDKTASDVGVLCGWDANHAGDCTASDEVRFFKVDQTSVNAVPMDKYKAVFYKQAKPNKDADYTCTIAKFKNARDVKNLLHASQ